MSVWVRDALGKVLGIDFLLLCFEDPQLPSIFNKAHPFPGYALTQENY